MDERTARIAEGLRAYALIPFMDWFSPADI